MNLKVDPKNFEAIANEIQSDQSPVGIDAKKTHVIILQKLLDIQEQLDRIESKIEEKI